MGLATILTVISMIPSIFFAAFGAKYVGKYGSKKGIVNFTCISMDTYAHTQDKPRLELAEKLEADFYSQDIGSPKSGSVPVKENLPDSIQITPEGMLKVVRQMNPEQRREFTRLLFA